MSLPSVETSIALEWINNTKESTRELQDRMMDRPARGHKCFPGIPTLGLWYDRVKSTAVTPGPYS